MDVRREHMRADNVVEVSELEGYLVELFRAKSDPYGLGSKEPKGDIADSQEERQISLQDLEQVPLPNSNLCSHKLEIVVLSRLARHLLSLISLDIFYGAAKFPAREVVASKGISHLIMTSKDTTSLHFFYSTKPSSLGTAKKIFAEASATFRSSLSVEDRTLIPGVESPETLVNSLTTHIESLNTPHQSRLHDAMSNVASVAESLGPYFQIIQIFVSSHPEYAAIAWGGIRLIFQVCLPNIET